MYKIRRPPSQNFFCSLSPSWRHSRQTNLNFTRCSSLQRSRSSLYSFSSNCFASGCHSQGTFLLGLQGQAQRRARDPYVVIEEWKPDNPLARITLSRCHHYRLFWKSIYSSIHYHYQVKQLRTFLRRMVDDMKTAGKIQPMIYSMSEQTLS